MNPYPTHTLVTVTRFPIRQGKRCKEVLTGSVIAYEPHVSHLYIRTDEGIKVVDCITDRIIKESSQ